MINLPKEEMMFCKRFTCHMTVCACLKRQSLKRWKTSSTFCPGNLECANCKQGDEIAIKYGHKKPMVRGKYGCIFPDCKNFAVGGYDPYNEYCSRHKQVIKMRVHRKWPESRLHEPVRKARGRARTGGGFYR